MPSFEPTGEPVTSRRGFFWTGAEKVDGPFGTVVRGPMYVEWESPVEVTRPYPLVLIHGGGGQGLDWMQTYDGRPGWAPLLVQRGYTVFVVDRPCHGRSAYHPDVVGPMGAPFPFQAGEGIFRPHIHPQWPGSGDPVDDEALAAIVTSSGPMPADLAVSQQLDQSRGAELLDRIGPAVLVSHSMGGPAGFLIADARPDLVKGLVSIEAVGPPFSQMPPLGLDLKWGLTQAPLTYDPPASTPDELGGQARKLPNLARFPIVYVSAPESPLGAYHDAMVEFLRDAGCDVDSLRLEEQGVEGNGHAMMLETNNAEALEPIARWIESKVEA